MAHIELKNNFLSKSSLCVASSSECESTEYNFKILTDRLVLRPIRSKRPIDCFLGPKSGFFESGRIGWGGRTSSNSSDSGTRKNMTSQLVDKYAISQIHSKQLTKNQQFSNNDKNKTLPTFSSGGNNF